jgi:beta-glucanase (GH16 family)
MLAAIVLSGAFLWGSGGSAAAQVASVQVEAPVIVTRTAQNGAVIVTLATKAAGAAIYYTTDGSTPTTASQKYEAPFLIDRKTTVKALAAATDGRSKVVSRRFAIDVPPDTLVWSDEFNDATGAKAEPDPHVWTYDTGHSGFGNHELEHYCAWGSDAAPCSTANPSAYVGADGALHIVAQKLPSGEYASARLKSQGLFSFQYGRFEVRARVPEAQGFWPAAWLLGNNIATVDWPACGEMDVLERVNAALTPDWNEGSIHGIGFTGDKGLGTKFYFPAGQTAAGWHTYGMIWTKGTVAYYIDDPAHPYVTYTTKDMKRLHGAVWPFDDGQSSYILLNLAIGGDWPHSPDASTPFPAEMLVDYVRVYTN